MKPCRPQRQPSLHISNCASSRSQSRDDQDPSSNAMSVEGDLPLRKSSFLCFLHQLDLNHARMVIAEMVGTFILMFCLCGNMASTKMITGEVGILQSAATAGLTIIVVIFCVGPISGAHVNPAITVAFATFACFPWSKVPLYILAQILGSVFGTYVGNLIYGIKSDLMTTRPLQSCSSAFWVELLATFIIVFLLASLAYEAPSVGKISGLVVGVVIGLAVLITGPVSGGSTNPARSIGPALISRNFNYLWIYIIAPTIGAVSGGLLYRFLRLRLRPRNSSSSSNTDQLGYSMFLGVRAEEG